MFNKQETKILIMEEKVDNDNIKIRSFWESLVVQRLGLHAFTAKGLGSSPGWETMVPQPMAWPKISLFLILKN